MIKEIIQEEIGIFAIETNDEYYEAKLFSNSLNESVGWRDIISLVRNIVDKRKTLFNALKKFNASNSLGMKKHLLMVMITILSFNTAGDVSFAKGYSGNNLEQIAQKPQLTHDELMQFIAEKQSELMNHQIQSFQISESSKEFIKKHEGLSLKPYKLGDGMITIGYGHAEPIKKSWFRTRMHKKITQEAAEAIFENDIKKIDSGLKEVLQRLRRQGVIFEINQSMYDAMVSMAFNMGPYGLETSEFILALKETKDPVLASEMIKISRIKNFAGLQKRRGEEYKLFTSQLNMPV